MLSPENSAYCWRSLPDMPLQFGHRPDQRRRNLAGYMVGVLRGGDILKDSIEANEGFAKEYGVKFGHTDVPPDVTVSGDLDCLNQVMANLLSNAAKFSHIGGKVEVSIVRQDDVVKVSISDHGPGIPEQFRKHIFGRFRQSDVSDTRHKSGAGLGLNITRLIIEKHGGNIDFHSVVGNGSTFFFTLPVID